MPVNQQQDVTCKHCGWVGMRYKIMNRPCPRCGRAAVIVDIAQSNSVELQTEPELEVKVEKPKTKRKVAK